MSRILAGTPGFPGNIILPTNPLIGESIAWNGSAWVPLYLYVPGYSMWMWNKGTQTSGLSDATDIHSFSGFLASVNAGNTTTLGQPTTVAPFIPLYIKMSTGATLGQGAGFVDNSSNPGRLVLGSFFAIKFALRLEQTANMRIWLGLTDQAYANPTALTTAMKSDTPAGNLIGFRYSTPAGDTKYQCVTQTAAGSSTKNPETTPTHVDTNLHTFQLIFDRTNIIFLIDDIEVGRQSGNLPALSVKFQPFCAFDNAGTTTPALVDFVYVVGANTV